MKFEGGYPGHDSMRIEAEKMFRDDIKAANKYDQPKSASSRDREKARPYARGGHVKAHGMPKFQRDMKIPHRAKAAGKFKQHSFEGMESKAHGGMTKDLMKECHGGAMKKGGEAKQGAKSFGSRLGRSIGSAVMPKMTDKIVTKRINNGKFTLARGGYAERDMVGDHPSHKRPHINYESEMKGAHATRRDTHSSRIGKGTEDKSHGQYLARGGMANHLRSGVRERKAMEAPRGKRHHFALGGVGKIRHEVANKAGHQIKSARVKRNDLF